MSAIGQTPPDLQESPQAIARRNSLSYLFFLAFMFFMLNNSQSPQADVLVNAIIQQRSLELDRLNNWFHLNGTSSPDFNATAPTEPKQRPSYNNTFRPLEWIEPTVIQPMLTTYFQEQDAQADKAYWRNMSGFFSGHWQPLNITLPEVKPADETSNATIPTLASQRGNFPWLTNSAHARIDWNLREQEEQLDNKNTSIIGGNLQFAIGDESISLDVDGIHFVENGSMVFFASPGIVNFDIRQLASLHPFHSSIANRTYKAVEVEMTRRIDRLTGLVDAGKASTILDNDERELISNCTFVAYLHAQNLAGKASQSDLAVVESEIRRATGINLPNVPAPNVTALLYSPNCQLVLQIDQASSIPYDYFWNYKTMNYVLALSLVSLVTTILVVRQMEASSSPSALIRVSYWTIAIQGAMDSYTSVTHLTLSTLVDTKMSLSLLVPAFFASLSGLLFGLRYASSIRNAQPMPFRPAPPAVPTPAVVAANAAQARAEGLPLGTTEPVSERSALARAREFILSDESPLWLFLFCAGVASVLTFTVIVGWIPSLLIVLYSFWVPQIWLNAERGTARRALKREYMIGITVCRLFLPLYTFGCPNNILFLETSKWIWVLCGYQVVQLSVLLLQEYLDPRFFIPKRWNTFPERETWNYHPASLPGDLESGKSTAECTICFEPITALAEKDGPEPEVYSESDRLLPPVRRDSLADGIERSFGRWSYMVPPCHHVAHTKCLEAWMAIKAECPLCRRHLPAP